MSLSKERDKWREELQAGTFTPPAIFIDYQKYRDTDEWRCTRMIEQVCEMVLYYKDKADALRTQEDNPQGDS